MFPLLLHWKDHRTFLYCLFTQLFNIESAQEAILGPVFGSTTSFITSSTYSLSLYQIWQEILLLPLRFIIESFLITFTPLHWSKGQLNNTVASHLVSMILSILTLSSFNIAARPFKRQYYSVQNSALAPHLFKIKIMVFAMVCKP